MIENNTANDTKIKNKGIKIVIFTIITLVSITGLVLGIYFGILKSDDTENIDIDVKTQENYDENSKNSVVTENKNAENEELKKKRSIKVKQEKEII